MLADLVSGKSSFPGYVLTWQRDGLGEEDGGERGERKRDEGDGGVSAHVLSCPVFIFVRALISS